MNVFSIIMAVFALIGAADRMLGNRFGVGREFERGFMMLGSFALSMIGMIVMAPLLAHFMNPVLQFAGAHLPIDPSSFVALIFPNDLGGAYLAVEVGKDAQVALFNGVITSAMFACTVSYTLPVSMELVDRAHMREVFLGFLCGIVTVPVGSFIGGLIGGLGVGVILVNLIPQILFTVLIAFCLLKFPEGCLKVFGGVGVGIKVVITVGLALGVFAQLTGFMPIQPLGAFSSGAEIVMNSGAVLSGAFPFVYIVSKALRRPLHKLGKWLGISDVAASGLFSSLASSTTTFVMMGNMDKKGIVMNSAFAVSGAFTLGGHLAFTMIFAPDWLPAVMISKIVAGLLSLPVAHFVYKKTVQSIHRSGDAAPKEGPVALKA